MARGDKPKSGDGQEHSVFGKEAERRAWAVDKAGAKMKGGYGKPSGHQAAQHGGHRTFKGSQHSRH